MPEQYDVRTVDAETGKTTVKGPVVTTDAAADLADRWAEAYLGDRVTWDRWVRGERYQLHAGELY